MNETEFLRILAEAPETLVPSYRLYYNDAGDPVLYTMEDRPGTYVEVDADTYARAPFNVRVVDGQLQYVKPKISVHKLKPNASVGVPCDPRDVCVVVPEHKPHVKWNMETNEIS